MKLVVYDWHRNLLPASVLDSPDTLLLTVAFAPKVVSATAGGCEKGLQVASVDVFEQTTTTGIYTAVYDPEHYDPVKWPHTPPEESDDPLKAAQRFSAIAKGRGLKVGFAPSPDLLHGRHKVARCLTELVRPMAAWADFVDLQIQQHELEPKTYAATAHVGAGLAREANPGIEVYAQLSTALKWGATVHALMTCVAKARSAVDGFWLILDQKNPDVSRRFAEAIGG